MVNDGEDDDFSLRVFGGVREGAPGTVPPGEGGVPGGQIICHLRIHKVRLPLVAQTVSAFGDRALFVTLAI